MYGEPVIAVISLFEGAMLYIAGTSNELWVAYVTYMAFCITYSILITIARYVISFVRKLASLTTKIFYNSSEVAKGLKQESYGLVFGINTFLALLFQTILTLIVADSAGLALSPPDQVIEEEMFCLGPCANTLIVSFSFKYTEVTLWYWVSCFFLWPPTMPDVAAIDATKEKARSLDYVM